MVQPGLLYQDHQPGHLQLKMRAVNSEFHVSEIVIFVFHHILLVHVALWFASGVISLSSSPSGNEHLGDQSMMSAPVLWGYCSSPHSSLTRNGSSLVLVFGRLWKAQK